MIKLFPNLWAAHLLGRRFDYVAKVPLLPSHCAFFVFESEMSFFVGSGLLWLFGSCDFRVFVRGGELASFSSH